MSITEKFIGSAFDRCDKSGYNLMVRKADLKLTHERKPKITPKLHFYALFGFLSRHESAFLLIMAKVVMLIKGV